MDAQTVDYYSQNAAAVAHRYEFTVSGLASYFQQAFTFKARVLDVGCGSGRDMAYLALANQVHRLDTSSEDSSTPK